MDSFKGTLRVDLMVGNVANMTAHDCGAWEPGFPLAFLSVDIFLSESLFSIV